MIIFFNVATNETLNLETNNFSSFEDCLDWVADNTSDPENWELLNS